MNKWWQMAALAAAAAATGGAALAAAPAAAGATGAAGAGAAGAGGLLGGAGAAGAATGAAAPSAGLLGNLGAATTYGTGLGTQQTAMLAAQEAGMGGGLLNSAQGLATQAKPFMDAASTGIQTAQALTPQEQAPQPPTMAAPVAGMNLQQIAQQNQQAYMQPLQSAAKERMMRRQQRRGLV